jgi:asparaginyl-tRNA synthetase
VQSKKSWKKSKKSTDPPKNGEKLRSISESKRFMHRVDQIEEDLRNIPVWKKSAANFEWGTDFGGSDETILTMQYDTPVMVHRYPAAGESILHETRS